MMRSSLSCDRGAVGQVYDELALPKSWTWQMCLPYIFKAQRSQGFQRIVGKGEVLRM